jgi:autotransporter-associated beta strand protein
VSDSGATLTLGGRIQDAGQNRGLTKAGPGALVLGGNSLYTGPTNVSAGTLSLSGSLGNTTVAVGLNGTFINNGTVNNDVSVSGVMSGHGIINGSLVVNNGGTVDLTGGTLTVQGGVTNNGLFILSSGAQISGVTGFVNNGTLDLTTAGSFNPPNFTNNGTIIDASVVKTKSISKAGNKVTVTIDAYTGHKYQLQKSSSPAFASFSLVDNPKSASTGTVLSLVDNSATETSAFYRVVVNP